MFPVLSKLNLFLYEREFLLKEFFILALKKHLLHCKYYSTKMAFFLKINGNFIEVQNLCETSYQGTLY